MASGPPSAVMNDAAPKTETSVLKKDGSESVDSAQASGEAKVPGAELKKRQKAEKAARREQEKADRAAIIAGGAGGKGQPAGIRTDGPKVPNEAPITSKQAAQPQKGGQEGKVQHRRAGSMSAGAQPLPLRNRPSLTGQVKEPKKAKKEVGLFGHLYGQPRRHTLEGVSKEVHPAVLALGFQMSSYEICGSNARCVAMLLAFKKAIQSYTTPVNNSLARHLTSHYLSPQIDYLKSHRPISVSMGNAIRWLKDFIIHIDPDTAESIAKADICAAIDLFIRERITVADTAIATTASSKIRNGSTVATYAKSSIVEKTLLRAHDQGVRFKVIVVDNRPMSEGKNLVRNLAQHGLEVRYTLSAPSAVKHADLVLLGAHAMMANGRLYSRVGTAQVAMHAHQQDVPVIVCCESVKFTDRVALDSIVLNEIAPAEELLLPGDHPAGQEVDGSLKSWKDVPGLQLLNLLYDVTPAEYINMVITEYGSLPPSSAPVVHRISTERDLQT